MEKAKSRTASLAYFTVVEALIVLAAWYVLLVPRAPLPRDEIAALAESIAEGDPWSETHLQISSVDDVFKDKRELQAFATRLEAALQGIKISVSISRSADIEAWPSCVVAPGTVDLEFCLGRLEDDGGFLRETLTTTPMSIFTLLVVAAEGRSVLLLDAGRSAVVSWPQGPDSLSAVDLADATAEHLRSSWFRESVLRQDAPLFEVTPSYVFSFFLVGDCGKRVAWNFLEELLGPFLEGFLDQLHVLFDFEIDSQVVPCSPLVGMTSESSSLEIGAARLQADFLRHASDWPGDAVTRNARWLPPLIRFAAVLPSETVHILDADRQFQKSFAVQGWGIVAVSEPSVVSDVSAVAGNVSAGLSHLQAAELSSVWISNLRSWLTLSSDGVVTSSNLAEGVSLVSASPRSVGMASWELLLVAKALNNRFLQRALETLQNTFNVMDSLPDLVIRAEIGEMASRAAAAAHKSISAAQSGNVNEALQASRLALRLALEMSQDDTVIAQTFFVMQYKLAVHLPLWLPAIVPICNGLYRLALDVVERRRKGSEVS